VGAPVMLIQHEDDGLLQYGNEGWHLDARLLVNESDLRLRKTACDSFYRTDSPRQSGLYVQVDQINQLHHNN